MNSFKQQINELRKKMFIEVDDVKIQEQIEQEEKQKEIERMYYLKNSTPEKYWDASIKDLSQLQNISNFFKSDKTFLWIHGKVGTGKTYTLYALRNYQILKKRPIMRIIKEYSLDYKKTYEDFVAIDDVWLSQNDNYNLLLADIYLQIIDSHLENNRKILFTSNLFLGDWINSMSKINDISAVRIESRMSGNTDIIKLDGNDRRKK